MEKLTILERNGSRYQLRTPDIATMLGDKDQVSQLLEELAREKPTAERSHGEARLRVCKGQDLKTLPMPSAWVRNYLLGDKSDLVVFVGNSLSGITNFDRLRDPWGIGQEEATIESRSFMNPEDARTWATNERKKTGFARTRVVSVVPRCWSLGQLDTYANIAQTFGKQADQVDSSTRTALTTMRPLLVASTDQALGLARRMVDQTNPLPRNVIVTLIPAWSDDALYFWLDRLENQHVRDDPTARNALIVASCGFGEELERVCTTSLTIQEALKQPDEARKRLAASLDTFYDRIGLPVTVDEQSRHGLEDMLLLIHGEQRSAGKEIGLLDQLGLELGYFLFAQWMGLIQPGLDGTWQVPDLLLELIEARPSSTS
jgi:hypothetical protein